MRRGQSELSKKNDVPDEGDHFPLGHSALWHQRGYRGTVSIPRAAAGLGPLIYRQVASPDDPKLPRFPTPSEIDETLANIDDLLGLAASAEARARLATISHGAGSLATSAEAST